jgi:hypothetical protein
VRSTAAAIVLAAPCAAAPDGLWPQSSDPTPARQRDALWRELVRAVPAL